MLSTFHERISECFIKWITPPSLPPPSLKKLYFTTARKGSWKHDKSCMPRDIGVCSEFKGGLGLIFWAGAHSHMLASLQGSIALPFGPGVPLPYTHLSHFNPFVLLLENPTSSFLQHRNSVFQFYLVSFEYSLRNDGEGEVPQGDRLWQSGFWRGHLQENKTFLWPRRPPCLSSQGRLPLEGDVWAIWRKWRSKWRKGIFLGRWNTRIKVWSQEDI